MLSVQFSFCGRAISRVLSCAVICLARPLPDGSSGLPGARRAAVWLHFSLASDGACICPPCCQRGGSLLHCLFTLTSLLGRRFFSVALSRGLPLPDVIRHPALRSPDFPHLAICQPRSHVLPSFHHISFFQLRQCLSSTSCNSPDRSPGICALRQSRWGVLKTFSVKA